MLFSCQQILRGLALFPLFKAMEKKDRGSESQERASRGNLPLLWAAPTRQELGKPLGFPFPQLPDSRKVSAPMGSLVF